ncbi:uncharacterized protein MONBRDRAFT_32570 [Monosiga brevicollis MX1]|uniref:Ubiquinol-cytochrome C reductase hinge domain-containing protein n=1 Tax=Monosiga brevicollis TaxID=81824 RepID=A9V0D7_MONBE|nr:uncharacterized protein MONBRDRAFT_32570 [Monosiga brevicollis MX1]EDQ89138.1 predicted protein [Monosiga brevicollis MX1]|eukprot:XP_001746243.1 hypothetical protein [Monosiga brevicollis MX1]
MSLLDYVFGTVHAEEEPEAEEPEAEEEEEEEEEELEDPVDAVREGCASHCTKYKAELEKCEARVSSRSNTEETCVQELFDFLHCVDHCVSQKLFKQLK